MSMTSLIVQCGFPFDTNGRNNETRDGATQESVQTIRQLWIGPSSWDQISRWPKAPRKRRTKRTGCVGMNNLPHGLAFFLRDAMADIEWGSSFLASSPRLISLERTA
jgi:hypothetical protein